MRVIGFIVALGIAATLAACGGSPTQRLPTLRWVLTNDAERSEF